MNVQRQVNTMKTHWAKWLFRAPVTSIALPHIIWALFPMLDFAEPLSDQRWEQIGDSENLKRLLPGSQW